MQVREITSIRAVEGDLTKLAFSPSGDWIVVAADVGGGVVFRRSAEDRLEEVPSPLRGSSSEWASLKSPMALAIHQDGTLAVGRMFATLEFWKFPEFQRQKRIRVGRGLSRFNYGVYYADFSREGDCFTAVLGKTVLAWRWSGPSGVDMQNTIFQFQHPDRINGVSFGHGSQFLATTCLNGIARFFRLSDSYLQHQAVHALADDIPCAYDVVYSHSHGCFISVGQGMVCVTNLSEQEYTAKGLKEVPAGWGKTAISNDGEFFAIAGFHETCVFSVETLELLFKKRNRSHVTQLRFHPAKSELAEIDEDGYLRIWSVDLD